MGTIRRTNQGGSVKTFIIIGVILAVGLIGTVYILKQRGDQVRKDQAIATYEQQKADEESAARSENASESAVVNSGDVVIPGDSVDGADSSTAQEMPATGPKLMIGELIGTYLLAMVTVSYILSRRSLTRYL